MGCCQVTLLVFTWCLSSESSVLNDVHPPSVLLLLNSGEISTSVSQSQELLTFPLCGVMPVAESRSGCVRSHLLLIQPGSLPGGHVAGMLSSANSVLVGFHILAH